MYISINANRNLLACTILIVLFKGVCIDLMKTMAAELNATFSLYKRKDGIWGSLKNGSWSGMLQDLVNGNADMIVSGIGFSIIEDTR